MYFLTIVQFSKETYKNTYNERKQSKSKYSKQFLTDDRDLYFNALLN